MDYQTEGRRLNGHMVATYDNVFTVTQCASRCQLLGACASYNFLSAQRRCEINSASHVTNPDDVISSDDTQYFKRDAYTIDSVTLCIARYCYRKYIVRPSVCDVEVPWPYELGKFKCNYADN